MYDIHMVTLKAVIPAKSRLDLQETLALNGMPDAEFTGGSDGITMINISGRSKDARNAFQKALVEVGGRLVSEEAEETGSM